MGICCCCSSFGLHNVCFTALHWSQGSWDHPTQRAFLASRLVRFWSRMQCPFSMYSDMNAHAVFPILCTLWMLCTAGSLGNVPSNWFNMRYSSIWLQSWNGWQAVSGAPSLTLLRQLYLCGNGFLLIDGIMVQGKINK
jgi:hypothetical protein